MQPLDYAPKPARRERYSSWPAIIVALIVLATATAVFLLVTYVHRRLLDPPR